MQFRMKPSVSSYFIVCARLRGIAPTSLVRRILDTIADDMMIGAILDDQDHIRMKRGKGERPFKEVGNG